MPLMRLIPVLATVLVVAACGSLRLSPYRIDVRQGNMVTQDMVAKLKPGMTRDQVRFVLGTPLIADIFHADRWDYVYRFQPGRGDLQERKFTVFFADGKLARVAGDVAPAVPASAGDGAAASVPQAVSVPAEVGATEPSAAGAAADATPEQPAPSTKE
jgi:outer membrane protein assembly factor BamE